MGGKGPVKIVKGLAVALGWILIWQLLSLWVGKELLVPSPKSVIISLASLAGTVSFWETVSLSVVRIIIGYAAGVVAGVVIAVITSAFKPLDVFLSPAQHIIKATPIASFIILALVWINGSNIPSFITFLMVLPIIWGNVSKGIAETDKHLLEMARVYRFGRIKTFRTVYFHSALPYFAAAAATSMGLAWKAGIAAEVLALPGIAVGTRINDSKIYLEMPELFAWSLVVVIISMLLEKAITTLLGKIGRSAAAVTDMGQEGKVK